MDRQSASYQLRNLIPLLQKGMVMLPIGSLMIEHRLIERALQLIDKERANIRTPKAPDTDFIKEAVDFILEYADKVHHAKEEDILFASLARKSMSETHKKIMDELLNEHVLGREYLKNILEGREQYLAGDRSGTDKMLKAMDSLLVLYPQHIEKEDKHFFIPVMAYFSDAEKENIINELQQFDSDFMHNKYKQIIASLEIG